MSAHFNRHQSRRGWIHVFLLVVLCLSGTAAASPNQPTLLETSAIFADGFSAGWENWSWGANINLAAAEPLKAGSRSIQVTYTGAWQGLFFHHPGVNVEGYSHLRLYIHGGSQGGQKIDLYLQTLNGGDGQKILLPPPAANTWQEVLLPLSNLIGNQTIVTGFILQDRSGGAQPAFYLDEISFSNITSPDGPTTTNGYLHPRAVRAGGNGQVIVRARIGDPQGTADIASVSVDASALGLGSVPLKDDGLSNDGAANDGLYGAAFGAASGTSSREVVMVVTARDKGGNQSTLRLGTLVVLTNPGGAIPAALPQHFGWGSNAFGDPAAETWKANSGVPWSYLYRYITWGWESWGPNFVERVVHSAWDHNEVPIITVYIMYGVPPGCEGNEGGACYAVRLSDSGVVNNYLESLKRAALQAKGSKPVIFNLEPDFYGFMQRLTHDAAGHNGIRADDPSSVFVALDKPGYPNTLAGFGRYLVDMIHTTAPNALVAPMASTWATGSEPYQVSAEETIQHAKQTANFINAMGGAQADLIIVEWSDRDAGSNLRPWWDDTDKTLPRPTRYLLWENALSAAAGKRLLLWQVPAGNVGLNNEEFHYRDNKAAYAFSHPRDLFDAGVIGLVFGSGMGTMTEVWTDNGFIAEQGRIAYAPPAAPAGLRLVSVEDPVVIVAWNENSEVDLWGYRVQCRLASGGPTYSFNPLRRSSTRLLLPKAGQWKIDLVAYDAMGNTSSASSSITVTVSKDPWSSFLPFTSR